MPGKLIAVEVKQGDAVTKGQKLVTLEAMKMEHSLVAPFDGIVAELNASEGAQVSEGRCWRGSRRGRGCTSSSRRRPGSRPEVRLLDEIPAFAGATV